MHKRRNCIVSILAWLAAMVPLGAHAASFCVNSAASLQAALTTAATNGQNDQIDIVAGNYTVVPGGFQFYSTEANSITILGGYTAACLQLTTAHTTLNGNGLYRVMTILISTTTSTAASVNIRRITFINGNAASNGGGGLEIAAKNGDVRLEANRFLLNHSDNSAGALSVGSSAGILTVRNNLFYLNDAPQVGAAELVTTNSSDAYVIGNTLVGNTATATAPPSQIGGLYFYGATGAHLWLSNNIFWNNNAGDAFDLYAYTGNLFTALNNDIGTRTGSPPDAQSLNNQSVDPQFASCGGILCAAFNLLRTSPLVDAGYDAAPGGLGSVDIEDKPRTIGPHVDIGAFEEDVLFANGFD